QLTISKSRREEIAQNYRGTVLTALKETQDALTATTSSAERLTHTQAAREQAATAFTLSRTRLQNGLIDMPTLLSAQQADLSAADNLAQSKLENLTAATNLILAVGGGWQTPQ